MWRQRRLRGQGLCQAKALWPVCSGFPDVLGQELAARRCLTPGPRKRSVHIKAHSRLEWNGVQGASEPQLGEHLHLSHLLLCNAQVNSSLSFLLDGLPSTQLPPPPSVSGLASSLGPSSQPPALGRHRSLCCPRPCLAMPASLPLGPVHSPLDPAHCRLLRAPPRGKTTVLTTKGHTPPGSGNPVHSSRAW